MLRRHVGENVKYQIDKNNNKNDHSDIDIKRLAIANHFFIFTQKAPPFFKFNIFILPFSAPENNFLAAINSGFVPGVNNKSGKAE